MHKIQKKNIAEVNSGLEVTSVLKNLHQWHLSFERETERAPYRQENLQSVFLGVKRENK